MWLTPQKILQKMPLPWGWETIFCVLYFDETEIIRYMKENNEQRLDVGLLYIDNYDESLEYGG